MRVCYLPMAARFVLLVAVTSCAKRQRLQESPGRLERRRWCSNQQERPCRSRSHLRGWSGSGARSCAGAQSCCGRGRLASRGLPEKAEHRHQTGARVCGGWCYSAADCGASLATWPTTGRRTNTWRVAWSGGLGAAAASGGKLTEVRV